MTRRGRPRASGKREGCGRIQRIHAHEREGLEVEKLTVLKQPHRKGEVSQLAESPLGRFCLRHGLDRALYDSGLDYGRIARHYHTAKLATKSIISVGYGSGRGVAPKKAEQLTEELTRIETPLKQLSPIGFSGARALCVYERETATPAHEVIGVLYALARLLRKIGR